MLRLHIRTQKWKNVKNPRFSYEFSFFEYFISFKKNPDGKKLRNFCKTEIYDNLTRKKKRKKTIFYLLDCQLVRKKTSKALRVFSICKIVTIMFLQGLGFTVCSVGVDHHVQTIVCCCGTVWPHFRNTSSAWCATSPTYSGMASLHRIPLQEVLWGDVRAGFSRLPWRKPPRDLHDIHWMSSQIFHDFGLLINLRSRLFLWDCGTLASWAAR